MPLGPDPAWTGILTAIPDVLGHPATWPQPYQLLVQMPPAHPGSAPTCGHSPWLPTLRLESHLLSTFSSLEGARLETQESQDLNRPSARVGQQLNKTPSFLGRTAQRCTLYSEAPSELSPRCPWRPPAHLLLRSFCTPAVHPGTTSHISSWHPNPHLSSASRDQAEAAPLTESP